MLKYLLDTSIYCQPIKPIPIPMVMKRWEEIGDEKLAISVITHSELVYGLHVKQSHKLTEAFDSILRNRFPILPVTREIADDFGALKASQRKKGRGFTDLDLLIAATARVHHLILVTLNTKDFKPIEGMMLEDWSKGFMVGAVTNPQFAK